MWNSIQTGKNISAKNMLDRRTLDLFSPRQNRPHPELARAPSSKDAPLPVAKSFDHLPLMEDLERYLKKHRPGREYRIWPTHGDLWPAEEQLTNDLRRALKDDDREQIRVLRGFIREVSWRTYVHMEPEQVLSLWKTMEGDGIRELEARQRDLNRGGSPDDAREIDSDIAALRRRSAEVMRALSAAALGEDAEGAARYLEQMFFEQWSALRKLLRHHNWDTFTEHFGDVLRGAVKLDPKKPLSKYRVKLRLSEEDYQKLVRAVHTVQRLRPVRDLVYMARLHPVWLQK